MGRGTVRSFGVNGLVVRICMLYGLLSNTFCQPHVSHKTGMRTSMGTGIGDRDRGQGWVAYTVGSANVEHGHAGDGRTMGYTTYVG